MKLYKIILILLLYTTLYAQYRWSNPTPSANKLFGVYFLDSLTGWSVGDYSTVLKTEDGGNTWKIKKINVLSTLREVYFIDKDNGWIIGGGESVPYYGSVLITTDGGENWTNYNPESEYGWNDICVLSKDLIYIAGFMGIYKSTDGGHSWIKKGGTNWSTTVFFVDSLVGWFGNTLGGLYKTIDGGNNWIKTSEMKYTWHKKIKFVDPQNGYLLSGGLYSEVALIYKTNDGGHSWQQIDSIQYNDYKNLEVIDSLTIKAVGNKGLIHYTTDGGKNWTNEYFINEDFYDITTQSKKTWIVGGGAFYGKLYYRNEGKKFTELSNIHTNSYLKSIDFTDAQNGISVGTDGTVLKTNNSGKSWEKVNLFSIDLTSVSYWDLNTIFIAGRNDEFIKTTDGGNTWNILYSLPNSRYSENKIKFFSQSLGYSLSNYGSLLKTVDGGVSWSEKSDNGMYKYFFLDSLNGWTLKNPLESNYSEIYHTTDGGENWISIKFQDYVNDIYFIDHNIGWLSSENSLYKSNDGGYTWILIIGELNFTIDQIIFTSIDRGYFLTKDYFNTDFNSIQYTFDGGLHFSSIIDYTFLKSIFIKENKLWAVGYSGQILELALDMLTDIKQFYDSPSSEYILEQNYPNPFNSFTKIRYKVPQSDFVKIEIFDVLGRSVRKLVNEYKSKGSYEISFDADELSSGVYIYKFTTNNHNDAKKLLILK